MATGVGVPFDPYALSMAAFQAGDLPSFTWLVEEHRDLIIGYLYRFVGDRAIAEELAQEVFLRVFQSRNYRPTAKFRTWLFRIATNLAINWRRDRRVDLQMFRLDATHFGGHFDLLERSPTAEEHLLRECRLSEVRAAIGDLPDRYRAAVLMHKYHDMEYHQIAEALGCSVPALKSLLFRAYEILRRRLSHLDAPCTSGL